MEIDIRPARELDVPSINRIHNQGIEDRIATLDLDPYSDVEKLAWFKNHSPREPILVATTGCEVIGYAALSLFSPRVCYRHVASLSIYIERSHRSKGVGKRLLAAILDAGKEAGFRKIILNAFDFNHAAISLYERAGFRHVGRYERQGLLDGRWVDTIIMEKHLVDQ